MPEVVLLRDFEDGVPKDFRVTFCESLPEDALCIQCQNVSADLYRDPRGHGYCHSCREMCKREDVFDCANCGMECFIWELRQESSLHEAIRKARVICPNSSPDEPVIIRFSALKAHLMKKCSCNVVKQASTPNMRTSHSQRSTAYPGQPQEESKSSKMAVCSYCRQSMPKKAIPKHLEDCRENLQNSLQYEETAPKPKLGENRKTTARRVSFGGMSADFSEEREMASSEAGDDTMDAVTKFTAKNADYFSGAKCKTGKQALPTEPTELALQLNDALSKICDLEDEIAELKQAAAKTKDDTDLLSAAVPTIQGDMRNVQIQCEQRILQSEKTVSTLVESHTSLQETMYTVEEMVKNMTEKLPLDVRHLQQRNNWLHDAFTKLSAEVEKMKNDQREFVQNFFAAQDDTKKGKKDPFRH